MTYEEQILDVIKKIEPLNAKAIKEAQDYQDTLVMPPNSMGTLQQIALQLAGITGNIHNVVDKKRIIVLCADNGVVEEGVSSAPQSVTVQQAVNMTKGLTGMSCLAKHFSCDVQVVDVGIKEKYTSSAIINLNIKKCTNNIAKESAMSRENCARAIMIGVQLAKQAKEEGYNLVGVGEMGIGNTTTSTAVLASLTDSNIEDITGRGGGLTDSAYENKKAVILKAINVNKPNKNDAIDCISKVGGLDIASMCGVFLGCALYHLPAVIDGYISIVAALCAVRLCKNVKDYIFPSHCSKEAGYKIAAKELGLNPYLYLDMRLGEGSGCPMSFMIIEASCVMMNEMATFKKANIDDSYLQTIREGNPF